jgi:hypothetical protein
LIELAYASVGLSYDTSKSNFDEEKPSRFIHLNFIGKFILNALKEPITLALAKRLINISFSDYITKDAWNYKFEDIRRTIDICVAWSESCPQKLQDSIPNKFKELLDFIFRVCREGENHFISQKQLSLFWHFITKVCLPRITSAGSFDMVLRVLNHILLLTKENFKKETDLFQSIALVFFITSKFPENALSIPAATSIDIFKELFALLAAENSIDYMSKELRSCFCVSRNHVIQAVSEIILNDHRYFIVIA